jgi:hypothetical protein
MLLLAHPLSRSRKRGACRLPIPVGRRDRDHLKSRRERVVRRRLPSLPISLAIPWGSGPASRSAFRIAQASALDIACADQAFHRLQQRIHQLLRQAPRDFVHAFHVVPPGVRGITSVSPRSRVLITSTSKRTATSADVRAETPNQISSKSRHDGKNKGKSKEQELQHVQEPGEVKEAFLSERITSLSSPSASSRVSFISQLQANLTSQATPPPPSRAHAREAAWQRPERERSIQHKKKNPQSNPPHRGSYNER